MTKNDTLLVFCEVLDPLGKAIHRVAEATKTYAPDRITFVNHPTAADLQVVPTIGLGQVKQIQRYDIPYAIWQLCYLTTEKPFPEFWQPIWESSILTASYYDLPVTKKDNFLLTPIGYDVDTFFRGNPDEEKFFDAMITGYVDAPVGEELANVVKAFDKVIHIGGNIGLDGTDGYSRMENVDDRTMRHLYQNSKFSIGLRHSEGFELPVLEGQACGAVGVAFNLPCYTRWFEDFAIILDIEQPVLPQLQELAYRQEEIMWLRHDLSKFYWENIISNFWGRLLEQWDKY